MKSLKHLQENLQWFDITFLSQYYGLDSKREIKLPISLHFFALPASKELLLASSLLPLLLVALIIPTIDPKIDFLRFPILTVIWLLIYAVMRKRQVKAHLGINTDDQTNSQMIINNLAITLPQHLTGEPIAFAKEDIEHLRFDWHCYHDSNQVERKRAHALLIKLKQGQEFKLSSMVYPLRSLLYLAIFFDYPIVMQENKPPKERIVTFFIGFAITIFIFNILMIFITK